MSKIKLLNNQGDEVTIEHSDASSKQGNSVVNIKDITKQVDTIADLKLLDGTHKLVYVTGYHTRGDGAFGSHFFEWDATSVEADNGGTIIALNNITTGRYKLKYDGAVNVKWFGAIGDYTTDDTNSINIALSSLDTNEAILFEGIFRYTGTLIIPPRVKIKGLGAAKIAAFPQTGGDKSLLRDGYKHLISGSAIIFDGTGTLTTYSTNRSDKFDSIVPMVLCNDYSPTSIEGIAFIQDMNVLDSDGNLTTSSNDNRATNYTAGIIDVATHSYKNDITVFGYFYDTAYIIHNQDGDSNPDPDYQIITSSYITSGVAIIGHDTDAGSSSEGLTGAKFIGCNIQGADHHNRPDGIYTVNALYIDGFVGTKSIRGHNFTGCNFRTYANNAISFDHATHINFSDCLWEFPPLSGVDNADKSGGFVGTTNTLNFTATGCDGTGDPKFLTFLGSISGKYAVIGAGGYGNSIFGEGKNSIRVGDKYIQLTDSLSSTVSGWRIENNSNTLLLKHNNSAKLIINENGGVQNFGFTFGGSKTVSNGAITIPAYPSTFYGVIGEGNIDDDLDTINGGVYDGQLLILRSSLSASKITLKDGTGNLRLVSDRLLSSSQDRIQLMYDGTNWCELSYSDNS